MRTPALFLCVYCVCCGLFCVGVGFTGVVTGSVSCMYGSYNSSFSGCIPLPCYGYNQTGYVSTCIGSEVSGTTCTAYCAYGYSGPVSGNVTCFEGSFEGSFSGCLPLPCPAAYMQSGYNVSCSGTASGSGCTAVCASGNAFAFLLLLSAAVLLYSFAP